MPQNTTSDAVEAVVRYADHQFRFVHDDPQDHIFSILRSSGSFYELELLEMLADLLRPGDLIVDAGANIGTHSIFWAGICRARVIAFEPVPGNAAILRRNVALNGLGDSIRVEEVGLGAAPGTARSVSGAEHNRGMTTLVLDEGGTIKVSRLDDFRFESPVRLLKIDVEGMERQVLEGAVKTLKRDHPYIALEAADRASFLSIARFLGPLGYKVVGTYNYTPTHLFVPKTDARFKDVDGTVLESLVLVRFEWTSLRDVMTSRLATLDRKLNERLLQIERSAEANVEWRGAARQLEELATRVTEGISGIESRFGELARMQEALSTSRARVAALERELAVSVAQESEAKAAAEIAAARITALEKQFAVSLTQYEEARLAAETGNRRIAALEKELADAASQLAEVRAASQAAQSRIETLEKDLAEAVAVNNQLRARSEAQSTRHAQQIAQLEERLKARDEELAREKRRADSVSAKLTESRRQCLQLRAEIDRLTKQARAFAAASQTEEARLRERIDTLRERAAARTQQIRQLRTQLNRARGLLHELAGGVEAIAGSGRWRIGDRIGRLVDTVRKRGDSPRVMEDLRRLAGEARTVASAVIGQTAPERLSRSGATPSARKNKSSRPPENAVRISKAPAVEKREPPRGKAATPKAAPHAIVKSIVMTAQPRRQRPVAVTRPEAAGRQREEDHTRQRDGSGRESEPTHTWYVRKIDAPGISAAQPVSAAGREDGRLVSREDYSVGWQGKGWANGPSELLPGGEVRAREKTTSFGFVSRRIGFERGGLVEVVVKLSEGVQDVQPCLRIRTEDDTAVGPDVPLSQQETRVLAFAPARARALKLYVLAPAARAGLSFRIRSVEVFRGDAERHLAEVRRKVGEPIIASLASIPSRREMLRDSVASLLVQCDKVRVFLNNYPDVPEFLSHPRIEVRRSQDWDDRGDAGKMFWVDKDEGQVGYRLIVDDDLIFPPDFAEVMCAKVKAHKNRAIYATHGVLLRQPVVRYYEPSSRAATFHFRHAIAADRSVHIGATNALCFHTSAVQMKWADFKYCNSADIWLALYAQKNRLPVLTPARPANWVNEGRHENASETIYHHSLQRTRSRFDSSLVQDAVLRQAWPLTIHVDDRPKWGLAVLVEDAQRLSEALDSWLSSVLNVEWVVIVVFDRSNETLSSEIGKLTIKHETHLVDSRGDPVTGLRAVFSLVDRIGVDRLYAISDRVRVAAGSGNVGRLSVGSGEYAASLLVPEEGSGICGLVVSQSDRFRSVADPAIRCGSDVDVGAQIRSALTGWREARKNPSDHRGRPSKPIKVNDVFDRVLVLNLDRRPDRWREMTAQLQKVGISAERFAAVDGRDPDVLAEYERYAASPPHVVSKELPPIRYSADLYRNYVSQAQRVAYLEAGGKGKAIRSAGAWGYLRSYEAILERALEDQVQSLLVFDDDVLLHNRLPELFAQVMEQIPDDWLILQFGTLQYNWSSSAVQWRTPMLYQTNGTAIGSHAVGMRFEVMPYLLDHVKRMDMPFDIGALSSATRAFADRCFVIYPNLAIQRLTDSEIGTSEFLQSHGRQRALATYRWNIADYIDEAFSENDEARVRAQE